MIRYVAAIAALTLVYALVLASFHLWDLLFGAALSTVVVFRDIVVGTWEVALVTLHLRPLERPGIVAVPVGDRTPFGVAIWTLVTGLPPGSYFVDVDRERGVALIHVLDAGDPEAFREQQEVFYRRYQSKVFP